MLPRRPIPQSLSGARFHDDPPEDIQNAFGGWAWFAYNRVPFSYRIGLFGGLGWQLPTDHANTDVHGIRIRKQAPRGGVAVFGMEFGRISVGPEVCDVHDFKIVHAVNGLRLDQLKPTYYEYLALNPEDDPRFRPAPGLEETTDVCA